MLRLLLLQVLEEDNVELPAQEVPVVGRLRPRRNQQAVHVAEEDKTRS